MTTYIKGTKQTDSIVCGIRITWVNLFVQNHGQTGREIEKRTDKRTDRQTQRRWQREQTNKGDDRSINTIYRYHTKRQRGALTWLALAGSYWNQGSVAEGRKAVPPPSTPTMEVTIVTVHQNLPQRLTLQREENGGVLVWWCKREGDLRGSLLYSVHYEHHIRIIMPMRPSWID